MKKGLPYVKCPRCDLNYIPKDEELCDVCKAELKLIQSGIADDEEEILCPICKQNYISLDEDMCLKCVERIGDNFVPEKEDEWDYADEEKEALPEEELEIVSFAEIEEEEEGEDGMFDDEEEPLDDDFEVIDSDVIIDDEDDDDDDDDDDDF